MIYVTSGGGTGCTLVVTGVAGDNVTVSKDGKTYSKTFKDDGIATFKGLKTGTWTVTMTDGTSTASRTVTIDSDYTLTITYFSATINVTYPEGSTCTATDGTTTLSAPDTSGTWACVVPNAGTWTVTATNGTDTATETVTITAEGQVETVELSYRLFLFANGNRYSKVTGGWGKSNYDMIGLNMNIQSWLSPTFSNNTMILKGISGTEINTSTVAGTVNKIDLSKRSTLKVTLSKVESTSSPICYIAVSTDQTLKSSTIAAQINVTAVGTTVLDVSALSGNYYVVIYLANVGGAATYTKQYVVTMVELK